MSTTPLLQVSGLSIAYLGRKEAVNAVNDVSFEIHAGETVALVGESGSGKSTIARALVGLLEGRGRTRVAASGSITVARDGAPIDIANVSDKKLREVRGRHIGYVPQDPGVSLNPSHRIGAQIAEAITLHEDAPGNDDVHARVLELLAAVGIQDPAGAAEAYPHELSGGQRQRVLVAIGIAAGPRVLVADEPTSALDVTVQKRVLDTMDTLARDNQLGTLMITHDLAVAAERAQRILVMSEGRIVEEGPTSEIIAAPRHPYTQTLLASVVGTSGARRAQVREEHDGGTAALELDGIIKAFGSNSAPVVTGISLRIPRGQTYGLIGESGSGKTTLGRIALRLEEPTEGRVLLGGEDITTLRGKALRTKRRQLQYVQQNPYGSFNPKLTIADAIADPLRAHGIGSTKERREKVRRALEQVRLPQRTATARVTELSGGQLQRAAIARALIVDPTVIVADEPVSALDVSVQATVLDLLMELQAETGVAMLFISHDLAVVRDIAHTVGVIDSGRIVEENETTDLFSRPQHEVTQTLLHATPSLARLDTEVTVNA
ncbi:dipeptide ABC transporter ATP-binding protein [Corynebacterium timonense]|uniref:Peptide/nickel transport system ATP-binding protein n=1 Tax=Corynebacterium timonense TaxID=441500 RepID=A0A1H1M2H2_9CORY|nr:ABC transporter ATP-binding protein [Corynebacterium timonense]SDR81088.1 peptide/nickel transport system ATP-binding protein [Corynebacterium timonense]